MSEEGKECQETPEKVWEALRIIRAVAEAFSIQGQVKGIGLLNDTDEPKHTQLSGESFITFGKLVIDQADELADYITANL
jgi:hypothetical protein